MVPFLTPRLALIVIAAVVFITALCSLATNRDDMWGATRLTDDGDEVYNKPIHNVSPPKSPPTHMDDTPDVSEDDEEPEWEPKWDSKLDNDQPSMPEPEATSYDESVGESATYDESTSANTPVSDEPASGDVPDIPSESKTEPFDLVEFFLTEVQKPMADPDSASYKPYGAFAWDLKENVLWKEKMGKDICIIDIDNRPFNKSGHIFGPKMTWDKPDEVHGLSLGVMNHWLYAKIHGYQYYFVTFDSPEDRRASWEKPSIISKILKKHKTCVYLDSDAVFFHLDLPLEWLMNHWQIDPKKHSLSLSYDPNFKHNKDKFGNLYLNTGFIINQNNSVTFQILEDWDRCTDPEGPHPECTEFRFNQFGRPTDQGGFGTYIRYDYEDNIKGLPCSEANGFPEDPSECKGKFIRHMWSGKDTLIKIVTGHQIPGKFLEVLHKQVLKEKADFYMTKNELMKWP